MKKRYNYTDIHQFTKDLFKKTGCSDKDAQSVADVLTAAELRGIPSHGMLRIIDYIKLFEAGRINVKPNITIERETLSTAVINGDGAFGPVAGTYSMEKAIEKAEKAGSAWISTNNSNHYGIAGFYTLKAAAKDMIGISMTNANPLVAPTLSVSKLLGTNPIAVSVPAGEQPTFTADFATTPIARGKLAMMARKNENAPTGFVQDKSGVPSTNPDILKEGGSMLTLGGDYLHGSHKGFCMSAVVDIFSAVLSKANFGPFVPPSVSYLPIPKNQPGKGTGHFFGAMRIDAFQPAEEFKEYMDKWIATFRNATPAKGEERVYIPGDIERDKEAYHKQHGIEVLDSIVNDINEFAEKYKCDKLE